MNANLNTTNRNGLYNSNINSAVDQYNLNGHIMLGNQDNLASNNDGAETRQRLRNSLVTIFENDDPSSYRSTSFEIDKDQNSRIQEPQVEENHIQETSLHRINDVYDDEKGGRLKNLRELDTSFDSPRLGIQQPTQQHADDQNQGFRNGTDLATVHSISAFEFTENDDCEFETVSPEETERLWGIVPETGGGNNVSSQVQSNFPLGNQSQLLILSDTWHGINLNDRMAGLSGSNQEKILGRGLLVTETSTRLEQLCCQHRIPDLDNQFPESIRPPKFPQIHTNLTDYPQSDGNWTSASHRIISNNYLNTDRSLEYSIDSPQRKIQYSNVNSGGYESGSQNETHGNQVQIPQKRTQESQQQGNHGPIPRKRTRARSTKATPVQASGMNIAGGLSDLEDRSEMNEINRGSCNPTKRNRVVKTKYASKPRVEQYSYCMSRVSVSLEEMKAIDPDYDKHPHKAFFPERMECSPQAGMKKILMPTRMIDLLNARRQKAREEERKNYTGRKIPRDFKLRPVTHKDFEAFQAARKKEEETRSYENRKRRFVQS